MSGLLLFSLVVFAGCASEEEKAMNAYVEILESSNLNSSVEAVNSMAAAFSVDNPDPNAEGYNDKLFEMIELIQAELKTAKESANAIVVTDEALVVVHENLKLGIDNVANGFDLIHQSFLEEDEAESSRLNAEAIEALNNGNLAITEWNSVVTP
ncbi:hypothetical protein [Fusibacter sp. 3D3]|uniref:hypothetical protein n=1 Tax=Fusibacter sp. 3D3 TaxID=1048380 RepID=UPI001586DDFC|nr:hypothetical protein [Fusibacter sp. 3D3]